MQSFRIEYNIYDTNNENAMKYNYRIYYCMLVIYYHKCITNGLMKRTISHPRQIKIFVLIFKEIFHIYARKFKLILDSYNKMHLYSLYCYEYFIYYEYLHILT